MIIRVMRLAGMLLVAVVAMSFVVVSSAAAFSSNPLFVPAEGQTVRAEGKGTTLKSAGLEISCTENHVVSGNVSNGLLIGGIVIHYLGCTVPKGEAANGCQASSIGAPAGLIVTNTLHAVLGLELPANATVVVFLPVSGTKFVTFAESLSGKLVCNPESAVTGDIAGLISPIGILQTTGKVLVNGAPKGVDLTHGLGFVTAKLVVFGSTGELEQSDEVTFGKATEVT